MLFQIVLVIILAARLLAAECGDEVPPKKYSDNQASLLAEYRGKLTFKASTYWPGWPAANAFDGDPHTSWFTARGDAAAKGTKPWIAVEFPADVPVRRVNLLTNRHAPWQKGFSILASRVELLDKDAKVLISKEDELGAERADMEFRFDKPVTGVRTVRITSLRDEGDRNSYEDIAIGEVQVE